MKILLVNHFPLEGSGSGTYTRTLAAALAKRGHETAVLFPDNTPPAPVPGVELHPVFFEKDAPGCLPYPFPCFTTHPKSSLTFGDLDDDQMAQYLSVFSASLKELLARFQPDIIHSQHLWCLSALAAGQGVPCVVTAHGTGLMGHDKWPARSHFAREAAEGCQRIVAISRDNRRAILQRFPEVAEKTILLPNSYNDEVFFPEPVDRAALLAQKGIAFSGQPILLFAGKLAPFKGVDTLLRAAALYEGRVAKGVITLIAGDGAERGPLSALCRELGLGGVHFLGHQNQAQLRELYNAADVFAMPSRKEPFGLVALEAMACGLPVIASNEGGLPEFVNDRVGALVPPDDPAALSAAVIKELAAPADPQRRARIAAYAFEGHAPPQYIDRMEEIYASLLPYKKEK